MITKRKPHTYRRHWSTLIKTYGSLCYYCHIEPSTTIDHVIPYSFIPDDSLENLVPSCLTCNLTAGNMVFDDVNRKRQYIINNRKRNSHMPTVQIAFFRSRTENTLHQCFSAQNVMTMSMIPVCPERRGGRRGYLASKMPVSVSKPIETQENSYVASARVKTG